VSNVAKVSGSSVLTLQVFLRRTYGPNAFERTLWRVSAEDAERFGGIVLPVNWYPTQGYFSLMHAARALTGDVDFYERFGVFAAEYQINAFHKLLLRFTSPIFFLDRAGRLWSRSHDTGVWEIEGGDKRVQGTLRDFAIVDADYCKVLVAWIHRASQLTGTRGHTVHRACRAHGAEACVFEGWWA
jgi:hypothetical protein